jgi:hypothetical protein
MAKIKNVSGEGRSVPLLGGRLVLAGQVVDVDPDDVYGFTCQEANWACVDKAATDAHKAGREAELERIYEENPELRPEAPEKPEG